MSVFQFFKFRILRPRLCKKWFQTFFYFLPREQALLKPPPDVRLWSMIEFVSQDLYPLYPGTVGWSGIVFKCLSNCVLNLWMLQFVMFRMCFGKQLYNFGPWTLIKFSLRVFIFCIDVLFNGGTIQSRPLLTCVFVCMGYSGRFGHIFWMIFHVYSTVYRSNCLSKLYRFNVCRRCQ